MRNEDDVIILCLDNGSLLYLLLRFTNEKYEKREENRLFNCIVSSIFSYKSVILLFFTSDGRETSEYKKMKFNLTLCPYFQQSNFVVIKLLDRSFEIEGF